MAFQDPVTPADSEIVRRAIADEDAAWRVIVKECEEPLAAAARRELGHSREKPAPGDLVATKVAETFTKAWEIRERIDPTRPLLPFLVGILQTLLTKHTHSLWETRRLDDSALNPPDEEHDDQGKVVNPEADLKGQTLEDKRLAAERERLVRRLSEKLTPDQHRAIQFHFRGGLTIPETARQMRIKNTRAETLIRDGLIRFREAMKEEGLSWEDLAPLLKPERQRPKIKDIRKTEGPTDGATDRGADRPARQAPGGDPDPEGPGDPDEPPREPGDESGLG